VGALVGSREGKPDALSSDDDVADILAFFLSDTGSMGAGHRLRRLSASVLLMKRQCGVCSGTADRRQSGVDDAADEQGRSNEVTGAKVAG
jgi:hypothetical protein